MINLVKNEMSKIFHKKTIYVFICIIVALGILEVVITKSTSVLLNDKLDELNYQMTKNNLSYYNLENSEEKEFYIMDKTWIDTYDLLKDCGYDKDSWQYYMLYNKGGGIVGRIVRAEVEKNTDEKENAQSELDALIAEVKSGEWKKYVEADKNAVLEQIQEYKMQLDGEISNSEKSAIEREIKSLEYQIDGYNYRLNNNIPLANTPNSDLVDTYVSNAQNYLTMNKDEKTYVDRSSLLTKRSVESNYYVAKYKLDNKIDEYDVYSANTSLKGSLSGLSFIVLIGVILVASQIVAEEFNKGTIKQLLLRPYSRAKILLSKYCAVLLVFLFLLLLKTFVDVISAGFIGGFNSFGSGVILYNFNTSSVQTVNWFVYGGLYFIAILPMYLILITIAFALSCITCSTAISICLSLAYYMGSMIFISMLAGNTKYAVFLPSQNWDFTTYLFGGLPSNKYISLTSSIIVTVITYVVAFVIGFIIFKRKDIKNQ